MPYRLFFVSILGIGLLGCSALVNPDESRFGAGGDGGPGRRDGGDRDGRIVLLDGGSPVDDGGRRVDAPAPACTAGASRCEGNVLVECIDEAVHRTDCAAMGGTCTTSDGSGARCEEATECSPGDRACDGDTALSCNGEGAWERMACSGTCDPSTGLCTAPPLCPGAERLEPGSMHFDLCGNGDDDTYEPAAGCAARARANGPDVVFQIDLPTASTISLDLRDDGPGAIDTILYLRSACEDPASQVACGDDVLCSTSDIMTGCIGAYQVRQSRIMVRLEAGTYYVIADSFQYMVEGTSFGCGEVLLEYTIL